MFNCYPVVVACIVEQTRTTCYLFSPPCFLCSCWARGFQRRKWAVSAEAQWTQHAYNITNEKKSTSNIPIVCNVVHSRDTVVLQSINELSDAKQVNCEASETNWFKWFCTSLRIFVILYGREATAVIKLFSLLCFDPKSFQRRRPHAKMCISPMWTLKFAWRMWFIKFTFLLNFPLVWLLW